MRSFWSQEELQKLKEARQKGLRAKSIAKSLNRTESAVNKALRRYDLLKNPTANIIACTFKRNSQAIPLFSKPFHKRLTKTKLPVWVELKDVLKWLKTCSVSIKHITPRFTYECDTPFIYHGKYCTASQIVLIANRLRNQQNLLPFYVEGITIH